MTRFSFSLFVAALLVALVSCDLKRDLPDREDAEAVSRVTPQVIRTIPHDSNSFTQGLFFYQGRLYESTGLYGHSKLRHIDAKTGSIEKSIPVADSLFAEGCALSNNRILQLTWRERVALVYSFPELSLLETIVYEGEGWGLTADSAHFYMSNGSDTLFVRDSSFAVIRKTAVTQKGQPLRFLNELEFVKGKIYANVWYDKNIYVIDPFSGRVVTVVDCSEIVRREKPKDAESVLNGIAYDEKRGEFYITGKNWRSIFVVKIDG